MRNREECEPRRNRYSFRRRRRQLHSFSDRQTRRLQQRHRRDGQGHRAIAKQTRLLALNAAIEAARAGDAGLGFTVVANEVKELAKGTSKATDQIGEKIAAIQADTANAVQSITEIGKVFEKVSETSSKIAETVEEQSSTTQEIGENVSQAAAGASSIADKIAEVAVVAREAQQEASQTQAAAERLASMAMELHGLVSRFKVD
jgi:methyl-accepting chemotaxis protein